MRRRSCRSSAHARSRPGDGPSRRTTDARSRRVADAGVPERPYGPLMSTFDYPVSFAVEYPDRQLNRLTTFFRIFTVIPIAIVLGDGRRRVLPRRHGRERSDHRRRRRAAVRRAAADDPVPPEVPALVAGLEPRAAALHQPRRRLPRAARRPLSLDRRAAGGPPRAAAARTPRPTSTAGCRSSSGSSRSPTTSCCSSCRSARSSS